MLYIIIILEFITEVELYVMQIPYALIFIMCSGNLHLCSGMSSTTCSRQVLVCALLIEMSVKSIKCSTDLLSPSGVGGGAGTVL